MKHCKHCNVDVNDTKDYCSVLQPAGGRAG